MKYPKIVYKYRTWDKKYDKDMLLKNQLYLSSPKHFNDPFDCRIPDNYYLLDTPEKVEKYLSGLIHRHRNYIINNGFDLATETKRIRAELQDLKKVHEENLDIKFKNQDLRLGVLSLSAKWDDVLMWGHYGAFHKGYCIGFYEEKLRESRLFGMGGQVIYSNKFPALNPLDDNIDLKAFLETHYKAKKWGYEKEYRLSKIFYGAIPNDNDRQIIVPDAFIADVTIGLSADEKTKVQICKICKKKKIKVYQAHMVPLKFKIGRTEIKF
jgi:hypothetical protein